VKNSALNSDEPGWVKAIIYDSTILKKTPIPVNPIECFRMYPGDGWWGISEIKHTKEGQDIINKRLSQEAWYMDMKVLPPLSVDKGAMDGANPNEIFLFPGKITQTTRMNQTAVTPIQIEMMAISDLLQGQDAAARSIENITGISKAAQGRNESGVYTGKHFQEVMDSVLTRIKSKEKLLRDAIENLAYKAVKWAREDLKDGGHYEVYDPENGESIKLTAKDFEKLKDFDLTIQTTDAKLLSAETRIGIFKEFAQFGLDPRLAMIAVAEQTPGLVSEDMINTLKEEVELNHELTRAKLLAENSMQNLNQEKADKEIADIQNPTPEPAMPQGIQQPQGMPQQEMPQQPPAESAPVDEELQLFIQMTNAIVQELIKTGVPSEEAQQRVDAAAQSLDPALPLEQKVNELQKILGNAQA
jgi:hypothetical protein